MKNDCNLSPGELFTLSLTKNSISTSLPFPIPSSNNSNNTLGKDENNELFVCGVIYSYHSDDDSYDIRITNSDGNLTNYTVRISKHDLISTMKTSEQLKNNPILVPLKNDGLTIFWRLLRPEYVKHRGSQVLSSVYEIYRKHQMNDFSSTSFSFSSSSFPPLSPSKLSPSKVVKFYEDEASIVNSSENFNDKSTEKQSKNEFGYSEGLNLGPSQDVLKLMKSFSSPGQLQNPIQHVSNLNNSFGANDNMTSFNQFQSKFPALDDSDTANLDDLDDLPPAPPLFRRESSGPMYHTMPDPDNFSITANRPIAFSEDDIMNTGCSIERQTSDDIFSQQQQSPQEPMKEFVIESIHTQGLNSITPLSVLQQFQLLTGYSYNSGMDYPSPPLSPDALSSFSKTDPHFSSRNQEVHVATALLINCIIPGLVKINIFILQINLLFILFIYLFY